MMKTKKIVIFIGLMVGSNIYSSLPALRQGISRFSQQAFRPVRSFGTVPVKPSFEDFGQKIKAIGSRIKTFGDNYILGASKERGYLDYAIGSTITMYAWLKLKHTAELERLVDDFIEFIDPGPFSKNTNVPRIPEPMMQFGE